MFHLPHEGAQVSVWPTPGRFVAASAPRDDAPVTPQMSADGQVVAWDAFRYRQYLSGDLHFFDPRPSDQRSGDAPKEHHERQRKHAHQPKHHERLFGEALVQLQKHCAHPGEHRKDSKDRGKFCDLCGAADKKPAEKAEKDKE